MITSRPILSLPRHVEDWPLDWKERWSERAAIMEYLGNLPRSIAETRAEEVTRREFMQEKRQ
jgi:hypothetical protein